MSIHLHEATEQELKLLGKLDEALAKTSREEGGLIPALQATQLLYGYVPKFALERISKHLEVPMSTVFGVVTFYHLFFLKPRGKYTINICLGTACYVLGAQEVLDAFQDHLGIEVGETTEDRLFSLETGRCFGACGLAPVIMVNDITHQKVQPKDVPKIIKQYREQEKSVRGVS